MTIDEEETRWLARIAQVIAGMLIVAAIASLVAVTLIAASVAVWIVRVLW